MAWLVRLLAALLLVLLVLWTSLPGQAAVVWFAGAETGDLSEFTQFDSGSNHFTVTTPVRTGGYAMRLVPAGSNPGFAISKKGLNLATAYTRVAFQHSNTLPTSLDHIIFEPLNGSQANTLRLWMKTDGTTYFNFNAARATSIIASGSTILTGGTWYVLEVKWVNSATVGGVELKINGTVEFSSFGTNTSGQGNFDQFIYGADDAGGGAGNFYYDDLAISDSGYIGIGRSIARQGTSGTPTYDAWTKVGVGCSGSSIDNCWSNTPFSTTTSATDTVLNDAQTMLVAPFNATQSGHGTEVIAPQDVINGCKAAFVGKVALSSAVSIRRRIGGSDTDTSKTLTTSDAYYDDGIWTTTTANLNTAEVGAVHGSGVNLATVEDAWILCDFTASAGRVKHRTTQQ